MALGLCPINALLKLSSITLCRASLGKMILKSISCNRVLAGFFFSWEGGEVGS